MRIAVVGSRAFNNYEYLHSKLSGLLWDLTFPMSERMVVPIVVISGGARGADTLAEQWAYTWEYETKVFPAEWDKYGKSAGYKRNELIVNNCDVLVAFWDGESKGTKHSIDLAVKLNKPTFIFTDWSHV